MNISLSKTKPKKKNLGFGLNQRAFANVLGDDDDDDDDDNDDTAASNPSSRSAVNQAVAQEQEALRKRAAAALAVTSGSADVYDYDAAYDSIHAERSRTEEKQQPDASNKKSRYIGDLLKASQERNFQREIIMERKIAKEQDAESQQSDFRGKEEFVTASYKRKLQERKLWLEQEEEREKNEGNVERKGMAGFYGGLNTNVALGNAAAVADDAPGDQLLAETSQEPQEPSNLASELGFMEGFEQADDDVEAEALPEKDTAIAEEVEKAHVVVDPLRMKREAIEKKIAEARIRYFIRHNMTDELHQ